MYNQTADDFRQKAAACRLEADKAVSYEERAKYLDFALRWGRCADNVEELGISLLPPVETEEAA